MGLEAKLLFLFMCYVSVSGGRILSREDDVELDKELQRLTKPAVETIQTIYGDIYDCVDFYQQPAFDNPLLKNHSFHPQMKPTSYPKGRIPTNSTSSVRPEKLWVNKKGCPIGTVPIRQITKDDLIKAKNAAEIYASNLNPQTTDGIHSLHHFAVLHTPHPHPNNLKYYGAGMYSTLHNPWLGPDSYSSSQMKIQNGHESIIVGWTVNPGVYKDSRTRFFIYTIAKDKHCFNNFCNVFIQTRSDIPLDFVFEHLAQPGNPKATSEHFFVYRDAKNGNWFLQIEFGSEDGVEIGWWPSTVFTGLANSATYIEWGGEVYSPLNIPSPQMGSGVFGTKTTTKTTAACARLTTVNEENLVVDAINLETYQDLGAYYNVVDLGYVSTVNRHLFYYGGPGKYVGN